MNRRGNRRDKGLRAESLGLVEISLLGEILAGIFAFPGFGTDIAKLRSWIEILEAFRAEKMR